MVNQIIIKKQIDKQKTKQKFVYQNNIEIDQDMQLCINAIAVENTKIFDVCISMFNKQMFKTQTKKNRWVVLNLSSADSKCKIKIMLK